MVNFNGNPGSELQKNRYPQRGGGGVEFFLENSFITLSFDVSAKRFLQTVAKILHALHLRR